MTRLNSYSRAWMPEVGVTHYGSPSTASGTVSAERAGIVFATQCSDFMRSFMRGSNRCEALTLLAVRAGSRVLVMSVMPSLRSKIFIIMRAPSPLQCNSPQSSRALSFR